MNDKANNHWGQVPEHAELTPEQQDVPVRSSEAAHGPIDVSGAAGAVGAAGAASAERTHHHQPQEQDVGPNDVPEGTELIAPSGRN